MCQFFIIMSLFIFLIIYQGDIVFVVEVRRVRNLFELYGWEVVSQDLRLGSRFQSFVFIFKFCFVYVILGIGWVGWEFEGFLFDYGYYEKDIF